jgi:hypothetical protein
LPPAQKLPGFIYQLLGMAGLSLRLQEKSS